MEISIETRIISKIPCIIVKPKANTKLNTIVFYHGWHSCKEALVFKAKLLASFHYQVIIPDIIYHGERDPINYDEEGNLDKYFWKIIKHTILESDDFFKGIFELCSIRQIAVMGSSMGGFIASGVFVRNENIRALFTINGGSAFVFAETLFRSLEKKAPLSEIEKKDLSDIDPMNNIHNLNNKHLFMFHGVEDTVIPIQIQRYFYQEIHPIYSNKNSIKLYEYNGINHKMSMDMFEDIVIELNTVFIE